jgi:hypothetical protein
MDLSPQSHITDQRFAGATKHYKRYSGNAVDLHSGGVWFRHRPGHPPPIHGFSLSLQANAVIVLPSGHNRLLSNPIQYIHHPNIRLYSPEQWHSTFFVRVPPDIISLQLCTPKFGV